MNIWEGLTYYNLVFASIYVVTFVWCALSLWALIECVGEWRQDRKELRRVRRQRLFILQQIAASRLKRAGYMVKQAIMKVCIGFAAAYILLIIGPDPEVSNIQLLLRAFFIYDLYCFLMTKRTERQLRPTLRQLAGNIKQTKADKAREAREGKVDDGDTGPTGSIGEGRRE